MNDAPQREMPRYQCHKKVWALKISELSEFERDGSVAMYPVEGGFAPIALSHEFMMKHKPAVGGYYVVYDDAYQSFSPAKAFEEGYTRL